MRLVLSITGEADRLPATSAHAASVVKSTTNISVTSFLNQDITLQRAGEIAKLQTYHCGLLRLLFLANNDPDAPHCTVGIAVVNNAVKVRRRPQ
jgi:hypothetical protein